MSKRKSNKKSNRKAKRRIFLFFIFFGFIIGSLGYSLFSNVEKIIDINNQKGELSKELTALKEKEEDLNSDIKRLEDPEYIARYAREKYLYSKDGELIIRIPDE